MNNVILMGRLCADPEIGTTASGKKYAKYRLAVNRPGKTADGQPTADFINCIAWEKSADFVERWLTKGKQILIRGRIQTGSYEKDGQKHYTTDIVVEQHVFCGDKSQDGAAASQPPAYNHPNRPVYPPGQWGQPPASNPYVTAYVPRPGSGTPPVADFVPVDGDDDQLPF